MQPAKKGGGVALKLNWIVNLSKMHSSNRQACNRLLKQEALFEGRLGPTALQPTSMAVLLAACPTHIYIF